MLNRRTAPPFRQRGNLNLTGIADFFKKPVQKANPNPNPSPNPAGGDPKLQPKKDAQGNIVPGQNIDQATGLLKAQGDPNDPNNRSNDPLALFEGMFDNKAKAGDVATAPSFSLDPETLKKITEQLVFSPQMTPELLAKFKEGDSETISAILNASGRQAYSTVMSHLPVLTDKFVSARLEHDRAGLGRTVRESLTKNSLQSMASKNPVLKQQLDRVVAGLYDKYPDATPDWVAEQTTVYFTEIAKLMNPDAFKTEQAPGKKDGLAAPDVSDDHWAGWLATTSKETPQS